MPTKDDAIVRAAAGEALVKIARDHGVSPRTIRRWCEKAGKWTGKPMGNQRELPLVRDDGAVYENVHDAAWDIYLTTDALDYKGIVSSLIDACNGKLGKRAPYGHEWRWYEGVEE